MSSLFSAAKLNWATFHNIYNRIYSTATNTTDYHELFCYGGAKHGGFKCRRAQGWVGRYAEYMQMFPRLVESPLLLELLQGVVTCALQRPTGFGL